MDIIKMPNKKFGFGSGAEIIGSPSIGNIVINRYIYFGVL